MSAPMIDLQVFGETIVRRRLIRFAAKAVDHRMAFAEIVGILRRSVIANFRTRGVSAGSRWRDLKPATKADKARRNLDFRILVATGRLYGSLAGASGSTGVARHFATGQFTGGASDHVEEIEAESLRWGSRVPYGVYHQSSRPRTVIPYRPPVRLREDEKRAIARALQRDMMEG